jgi:hypothetical protein
LNNIEQSGQLMGLAERCLMPRITLNDFFDCLKSLGVAIHTRSVQEVRRKAEYAESSPPCN